jgi:hypothetical protein
MQGHSNVKEIACSVSGEMPQDWTKKEAVIVTK